MKGRERERERGREGEEDQKGEISLLLCYPIFRTKGKLLEISIKILNVKPEKCYILSSNIISETVPP